MRNRQFLLLISLVLLFLFFPRNVFAATISTSITNPSSSFQVNDEIQLHSSLDINIADGTNYYLRAVFYESGTTSYCGYTWNGSAFYNSPVGDGKNFLKITVNNNKWEGDLKVKIDSTDSSCNGSGEFKLKLQRFTDSGSASFDDQNELSTTYVIPTLTPTLAPTNTPTPTPKPTNTPTPTPSPTLTPTPTIKATPTPPKPTLKVTIDPKREGGTESAVYTTPAEQNQSILGSNTNISGDQPAADTSGSAPNDWGKLFIIMGIVLVCGACGILLYNNYKKQKGEEIGAAND